MCHILIARSLFRPSPNADDHDQVGRTRSSYAPRHHIREVAEIDPEVNPSLRLLGWWWLECEFTMMLRGVGHGTNGAATLFAVAIELGAANHPRGMIFGITQFPTIGCLRKIPFRGHLIDLGRGQGRAYR
jgi:hypothetical protein